MRTLPPEYLGLRPRAHEVLRHVRVDRVQMLRAALLRRIRRAWIARPHSEVFS